MKTKPFEIMSCELVQRNTAARIFRSATVAASILTLAAANFAGSIRSTADASGSKVSRDIVISDFEGSTYDPGWTTTGTAFGFGPAHGTLPRQNPVAGFTGNGLVNSFVNGDATTGTLESPVFTISREYITFLVGGGNKVGFEEVDLVVNGKIVRRATGNDSESLELAEWDVSDYEGQQAQISIFDTASDGWGHILVDDIKQTDTDSYAHGQPIARAMSSVKAAIPVAAADPGRPVYHFHAPANWMNDPNGFIYYDGWYHCFYQFNPYGSSWGNMHWGHARSKDLINWQNLPIALWPSKERGEGHVFSGSLYRNDTGMPQAFYTSIASVTAPRDPEVWAATPLDSKLIRWDKLPSDPIVSEATSAPINIEEWRDPFLLTDHGTVYMVTGGEIAGRGVVCLYKAENGALTKWHYCGPLFEYPDPALKNIECPNLIDVNGKWILLISVNGQVEYFTGIADLQNVKFITKSHGILNEGSYASQATYGADGQAIVMAWVQSVNGPGWHGCLAMPCVMTVEPNWSLKSVPIDAVKQLRSNGVTASGIEVSNLTTVLPINSDGTWEAQISFDPGTATEVGFRLPVSSIESSTVTVKYYPATRVLSVPGLKDLIIPVSSDKLVHLHIFLDRSLIDIFANGGLANETGAYAVDKDSPGNGFEAYTSGGVSTIHSLTVYKLHPAIEDMTRFQ